MKTAQTIVIIWIVCLIIFGLIRKWDRYDYLKNIVISIIVGTVFIYCYVIAYDLIEKKQAEDKFQQQLHEGTKQYNENHVDQWNGYKGTRRNSIAEDQKLREDGLDPAEYRKEHGY